MKRIQCPECPDGQVWNNKGPTNETCPNCRGEAFIFENDAADDADREMFGPDADNFDLGDVGNK